ncbi:MAG: glycosyltransferase family 2 protein [Nitrosarchaeum sp.]|nr:MAG: glycosyltransferase family 2 protein [Nitrosarchaeum sp.]
MDLVIGIPAYNEEKNIAGIISKLQKVTDKIIVCNDGSSDMTREIAEKMGAIVINHPKNLGYGAGIKSIFLKAREMSPDILVTFDADGQHRIEDIEKVIEPILKGTADIVIGSRFLNNTDNIPSYRKFGISAITKMANITTKQKITDSQSGFRAYNRKSLNELNLSERGMGISTEILIKADKKELKIAEVPIVILYEGDTSTHNPVGHGTAVILSTMKFVSIEHPLKFYGVTGLGFLSVGLFFIIWTLQIFSESRQILTNITLIGFGSSLIGVMFIMTAIILYSLVSIVREQTDNQNVKSTTD